MTAQTVPAAISHGGADSPNAFHDGPARASQAALNRLSETNDVLAAVMAGISVLEDDPRFNAGTGSRVRLDGHTIQMDAALMHSDGRFGAVAALERVRNPIVVAREVLDSPHLLIVGDGATRLARALGIEAYDPTVAEVQAECAAIREKLTAAKDEDPWANYNWRRAWNYETSLVEAGFDRHAIGTDTVGCCVRDAHGNFAAALSTGGTSTTMRGRVGDTPILGAGLYAGTVGAIAATGDGERIVEATLARLGYERIRRGDAVQAIAESYANELGAQGSIGVIALDAKNYGAATASTMAWAYAAADGITAAS